MLRDNTCGERRPASTLPFRREAEEAAHTPAGRKRDVVDSSATLRNDKGVRYYALCPLPFALCALLFAPYPITFLSARSNRLMSSIVPVLTRHQSFSGGKGRPTMTPCAAIALLNSCTGRPVLKNTKLAWEGI